MSNESKPQTTKGGVSFLNLLLLLFIGLKLGKVIDWSWWWVLAPVWIPLAIIRLVFMFAGFCFVVAAYLDKR